MKRVYINRFWSTKLIFCEVLNFLHIILQAHITNEFLSGNFYRLGTEVWNEGLDSSVDVLDEVFPKVRAFLFLCQSDILFVGFIHVNRLR